MRGKVTFASALHKGHRITPAYAGKSSRPLRPPECRKDHPRVCGEKELRQAIAVQHIGSPPHVRGKVCLVLAQSFELGITPACAGKRRGSCRRMHRIWDHPRMCGEKASEYTCPLISLGSPPHVRGKACATSRRACAAGITPACAGKRNPTSGGKCLRWDHPRMCGEKETKRKRRPVPYGSPPHVRGKD